MDCKPISVNTSFKVKPRSTKKYYDPLELYCAQRKDIENIRKKIIEKSGSHDYSNGFSGIIDGIISFIDGLVNIFKSFGPEPNYTKIKQYDAHSSKLAKQIYADAMKRDYDAIANAWKKVGDTLSSIMGVK